MLFLNNLYKSKIISYLPKNLRKKLKKKFNFYYVEISLNKLPKNNYPSTITLEEQENLIKMFNSQNYVPWTTCPYLVQILKLIFLNQSQKYNFLDFGGENIDYFLYLKKNFKNLNYFYFNQRKNIDIILELKKKYCLEDLYIIDNLDKIKQNRYHFINLGSVIQYIEDYKLVLNALIETNPEYIFFTATPFYKKKNNYNKVIIVKQVNILHEINFCYFFEYESFINIFKSKKYEPIFKTLNFTDNVNYNNFSNKYGEIEYADLLMKSKN